jgi:hypothetical protein
MEAGWKLGGRKKKMVWSKKKKYLEHLNHWIGLNGHCIGPSFDIFPFPKLNFCHAQI